MINIPREIVYYTFIPLVGLVALLVILMSINEKKHFMNDNAFTKLTYIVGIIIAGSFFSLTFAYTFRVVNIALVIGMSFRFIYYIVFLSLLPLMSLIILIIILRRYYILNRTS